MDLRQLKDKAAETFAKGKFLRAAELYEQYCHQDERDHQVRLRMGDAWAKSGEKERAIEAYARAAEGFARDGFLPRAIAASKLILELEPAHQSTQRLLAELYARRGGAGRPALKKTPVGGTPFAGRAGAPAVSFAMPAAFTPGSLRADSLVPRDAAQSGLSESSALDSDAIQVDLSDEHPHEAADGLEVELDLASSGTDFTEPRPGENEAAQPDEGFVVEVETSSPLPRIPLFSDLTPDAFIELFERCPLHRMSAGQTVFAQGARGDSFFVICTGSVRVFRELNGVRKELATLSEGAFFGEMALLSGAPRSATVEAASEDTQLLELSAPLLADLSSRYPQVATALVNFCRSRLLTNVMNSSALFQPFTPSHRQKLVRRFRAREAGPGTVIIHEGQDSDALYVVLSGEVEVSVGERQVARLKEGELFGEMSLLEKKPAAATVRASGRASLLRLPRADFHELISSHPQILMLVAELSEDRQRQNQAFGVGAISHLETLLL